MRTDSILYTDPATALDRLNSCSLEMFDKVSWNIRQAADLLLNFDPACAAEILIHERQIDRLEKQLGENILRLDSDKLSPSGRLLKMKLHLSIGNFEQLGNDAVKLQQIASRMNEAGISFSQTEKEHLYTIRSALMELLSLTMDVFNTDQLMTIRKVYALRDALMQLISYCRITALERIQTGSAGDETFSSFSCALGDIQTIANRCGNICTAVLDLTDTKKMRGYFTPAFLKTNHAVLVSAYLDKYAI